MTKTQLECPPARTATDSAVVSAVVPVYNEAENLPHLHAQIISALEGVGRTFEIVYVDDGSRDGSFDIVAGLAGNDVRVKAVRLRRNYGQTAALAAGFDHASGAVIVTLDADLQNDPADIRHLLVKLDEGFDVVSGWRRDRKDKLITRKVPSWLANRLIARLTGVFIHDYGCTLKAYRADLMKGVQLYGEMHRFLPAYAALAGGRVSEIAVNHRERFAGKTKYGLSRTLRVFLDLLFVKFFGGYGTKPMHFFGGLGIASCVAGVGFGAITIYQRLFQTMDGGPIYVHRNPLILLAVLLFLVGVQLLTMGFLAEILIRIYHESQGKRIYTIREMRNLDAEPEAAD